MTPRAPLGFARAAAAAVGVAVSLCACALGAGGAGGSGAWSGPPPTAQESAALERDLFRWTNVERIAAGLSPFQWDDRLAGIARGHSQEMVRLQYFGHDSPIASRRTVMMRAKLAGLDGPRLFVGENLARGNWRDQRARRIVTGWMESPGHRANILRPDFEFLGVGVAWDGGFVVATQVFSATR